MFAWLRRFKKPTASAGNFFDKSADDVIRVEVKEFAPGIVPFLSVAALTELSLYEAATQAVHGATNLAEKGALADIAESSLVKHRRFVGELAKRGYTAHVEMEPYQKRLNIFLGRIEVADWHQHVLSVLLVGGIVEDFLADLAQGVKDSFRKEAIEILHDHAAQEQLKTLLAAVIADDPQIADKLALWGRRLVGDTLLLLQDMLMLSEHREFVIEEMAPVFTEITGDHMQRMDSLGLTA